MENKDALTAILLLHLQPPEQTSLTNLTLRLKMAMEEGRELLSFGLIKM